MDNCNRITNLFKLILTVVFLNCSILSFAFAKTDSLEIEEASEAIDSLELEQTQEVSDAYRFYQDSIQIYLKDYIPNVYPEVIKDRLACLEGEIELTYDKSVLNWIKLYTIRARGQAKRILERSSFYFPIFEEALKRHNMPQELKYLSIVESALVPDAKSWAAAVGLWQFIPSTGKSYGLQQDWFIDERMDIYKSTDAACRYLKFLHRYHGNWHLALAAYNCGPGRVNWAVKRAGGKNADFWSIYRYLPRETRGYVPAFIAATYMMNYADEHFIFAENPQTFLPSDTILVSQFVNLESFANQIEVPKEQMFLLNPHLKKKAIPAYKKNYPLRFPASKRTYVDSNRVDILRACLRLTPRGVGFTAGSNQDASNIEGKQKVTHVVRRGQSLAYIALKYRVTVPNIRVWNRLASNLIYPNQRLAIWVPIPEQTTSTPPPSQATATQVADKGKSKKAKNPLKNVVHRVQAGDTLWGIAQKYPGTTVAKIRSLNNLGSRSNLVPGQTLVVNQVQTY